MFQAAILKANATSLIVLGVAIRSVSVENGICLANDTILPVENAALVGDINAVVVKIVKELVRPVRELGVQVAEYVALKAVLFFNPYNVGKSLLFVFIVCIYSNLHKRMHEKTSRVSTNGPQGT